MGSPMIDRSMKLERINLYLSEQLEEQLTFARGETTYALLGINLATDEAYIEVGEGIGTLPPLQDAEIEALYAEVLARYHAHLGHGACSVQMCGRARRTSTLLGVTCLYSIIPKRYYFKERIDAPECFPQRVRRVREKEHATMARGRKPRQQPPT